MQLQATHLRGQYRLQHCRADTQTHPGKAQTAVEETSSRAAQAAIEETHVQEAAHAVLKQTRPEAAQAAIETQKSSKGWLEQVRANPEAVELTRPGTGQDDVGQTVSRTKC